MLDDTETYVIQPNFTNRLEWVKGALQTANGELSVSLEIQWRRGISRLKRRTKNEGIHSTVTRHGMAVRLNTHL